MCVLVAARQHFYGRENVIAIPGTQAGGGDGENYERYGVSLLLGSRVYCSTLSRGLSRSRATVRVGGGYKGGSGVSSIDRSQWEKISPKHLFMLMFCQVFESFS